MLSIILITWTCFDDIVEFSNAKIASCRKQCFPMLKCNLADI